MRINIGNVAVRGFVNLIADKRLIIGTGSYTNKDGDKVFKESLTVFTDDKFDGDMPAKGDYVQVSGDLVVTPRRDKPSELNATMNVRFKNQLIQAESPKKAEASASADDI